MFMCQNPTCLQNRATFTLYSSYSIFYLAGCRCRSHSDGSQQNSSGVRRWRKPVDSLSHQTHTRHLKSTVGSSRHSCIHSSVTAGKSSQWASFQMNTWRSCALYVLECCNIGHWDIWMMSIWTTQLLIRHRFPNCILNVDTLNAPKWSCDIWKKTKTVV